MSHKRAEAAALEREAWRAQRRKRLLLAVLPLLCLGLGSNLYLLHLYLRVRWAGGSTVESFCAVSDVLNCVTVANSSYSTFLGLPIALYGVEYFSLLLILVLLSTFGPWRIVRAWDSLLFLATWPALPAVGMLAWISSVRIRSVCLLCAAVQLTVLLLFLVLLLAERRRLRALVRQGPRELGAWLRRPAGLAVTVLLLGLSLSQLSWAPPLFRGGSSGQEHDAAVWQGLPVSGLTIGPKDAPLRIEEFTDFQCSHCGNAHQVMMEVLRRFPGKVHLIHHDFPLDMACNPKITRPFHPNACRAAVYARCAAQQDKYWPYEELLFQNREQLGESNLQAFAARVGLDLDRLSRCLADPASQQAVADDIQDGIRRGLTGTPTLFVNGEKKLGMPPLSYWEMRVKELSR